MYLIFLIFYLSITGGTGGKHYTSGAGNGGKGACIIDVCVNGIDKILEK